MTEVEQADTDTSSQRSLLVNVLAVAAGLIIFAVLAFAILAIKFRLGTEPGRNKCSNGLKGIGIAMILYSNDYRFFPHMTSFQEENSARDVSTIYRSMIYYKYFDNPEALVCPQSSETWNLSIRSADDPRSFFWDGCPKPDSSIKPIYDKSCDPEIAKNINLSYTARRKKLNAGSVKSDTILSADKALRGKLSSRPEGTPTGSHEDGFNILYADGHVSFSPIAETETLRGLQDNLQFDGCDQVLKNVLTGK